MDSQVTLVNPGLSEYCLTFSKDSVKNAHIYLGSQLVYTLTSSGTADATVEIRDAIMDRVVARVERRELLWDLVTFPGREGKAGESTRLSKWLKSKKLPDGYPGHVLQTSSEELLFKSTPQYRIGVYTADDLMMPIAYYNGPARRGPPERAGIVFDLAAVPYQVDILAAVVYLEFGMRTSELQYTRAQGVARLESQNPYGMLAAMQLQQ